MFLLGSALGRPSPSWIGAVLAPLFFYPFSKTLWVAIELTLRPIDEAEPGDVRLDRANHRSVDGAPR